MQTKKAIFYLVKKIITIKFSKNTTSSIDIDEVKPDLIPYTHLSWKEECESSSFPPRNYYNYLINADEIDYVFPANDKELFDLLQSDEFLFNVCFVC